MLKTLCALALAASSAAATAQTVTLNGQLGSQQALLVIDGQPHAVTLGTRIKGVRLLTLGAGSAEVEIEGIRRTLVLGAGPARVGDARGGSGATGREIVLTAGTGGHFRSAGQINGKAVEFMVDTGATSVVIGQADADRIGLDYKNAPRGIAETANGRAPFHAVILSAVRIGDVEVANVEAAIIPATMGHVLLGNSFLTRFQMKRENDTLRLERR